MGVGGSVDLLTGFRQPAPAFFQRFGGEWLYRLYKNPSRHWKRMKKVMSFLVELFQN
jgi:exopolysaccharide biosynthesis WecB/TagA/CpsF family protein